MVNPINIVGNAEEEENYSLFATRRTSNVAVRYHNTAGHCTNDYASALFPVYCSKSEIKTRTELFLAADVGRRQCILPDTASDNMGQHACQKLYGAPQHSL